MFRKSFILAGLAIVLISTQANAQFAQYDRPIEKGTLENKIELQGRYSSLNDVDVMDFSVAAQMIFGNFELGLNVPVMQKVGDMNDWHFGDVMLHTKAKLFNISDNIGIALFGNFYLPTHSGEGTNKMLRLQAGAAANAKLLGFEVGGGAQVLGAIIGDDQEDPWAFGLYGYGRLPLLGLIAIQAAVEYFNSVAPNADSNQLFITPGIEFSMMGVRASLGTRIAINDDAEVANFGRLALYFNVGFGWN